eukprot:gnl/Chilomastix_cuspidata/4971.p1 GENE.gnl/Chilomastix_cuspidata/4971~~gnl/Chilomastix_cuspidata/4971.p1  ORF type:complete len:948 (-),score=247.16 gnl/Chilomastix_cuspidata/4971:206-3049(-)
MSSEMSSSISQNFEDDSVEEMRLRIEELEQTQFEIAGELMRSQAQVSALERMLSSKEAELNESKEIHKMSCSSTPSVSVGISTKQPHLRQTTRFTATVDPVLTSRGVSATGAAAVPRHSLSPPPAPTAAKRLVRTKFIQTLPVPPAPAAPHAAAAPTPARAEPSFQEMLDMLTASAREVEQIKAARDSATERCAFLERELATMRFQVSDIGLSSTAPPEPPEHPPDLGQRGAALLEGTQRALRDVLEASTDAAARLVAAEEQLADARAQLGAFQGCDASFEAFLKEIQSSVEKIVSDTRSRAASREAELRAGLRKSRAERTRLEFRVASLEDQLEKHAGRAQDAARLLEAEKDSLSADLQDERRKTRELTARLQRRQRAADAEERVAGTEARAIEAKLVAERKRALDLESVCATLRRELDVQNNAFLSLRKELAGINVDVRLFDEVLEGFEAKVRVFNDDLRSVRTASLNSFITLERASEQFVRAVGEEVDHLLRDAKDPGGLGALNFEGATTILDTLRREIAEGKADLEHFYRTYSARFQNEQLAAHERLRAIERAQAVKFDRVAAEVTQFRTDLGRSKEAVSQTERRVQQLSRDTAQLKATGASAAPATRHPALAATDTTGGVSPATDELAHNLDMVAFASRTVTRKLEKHSQRILTAERALSSVRAAAVAVREQHLNEAAQTQLKYRELRAALAAPRATNARAGAASAALQAENQRLRELKDQQEAELIQCRKQLRDERVQHDRRARALEERQTTEKADTVSTARLGRENADLRGRVRALRQDCADVPEKLRLFESRTTALKQQVLELAEVQEQLQTTLTAARKDAAADGRKFKQWQAAVERESRNIQDALGGELQGRVSVEQRFRESRERVEFLQKENERNAALLRAATQNERALKQNLERSQGEIEVLRAKIESNRRTREAEERASKMIPRIGSTVFEATYK